jgi:hypothetical protein
MVAWMAYKSVVQKEFHWEYCLVDSKEMMLVQVRVGMMAALLVVHSGNLSDYYAVEHLVEKKAACSVTKLDSS